jgi:enolase-phosphatase E1
LIKAIVTDIEGTTSSISFVHDILFPYAKEHIADFVRGNAEDPNVLPCLNDIRRATGEDLDVEGIILQLKQWIDEDKKITPLKALQGLIWEQGYKQSKFFGHIYPDAVENLRKWHEQDIRLFVYSSGSVYAQKLLFAHTEFGDLTKLFDGYFDTTIGAKTEVDSYKNILKQLDMKGAEVLFLSDLEKELDAAREGGLQTCCLVREKIANHETNHKQAFSFDDISLTDFS